MREGNLFGQVAMFFACCQEQPFKRLIGSACHRARFAAKWPGQGNAPN
jgi:hypothetical protein